MVNVSVAAHSESAAEGMGSVGKVPYQCPKANGHRNH